MACDFGGCLSNKPSTVVCVCGPAAATPAVHIPQSATSPGSAAAAAGGVPERPGSPTEELRDLHVVMLTKQLAEVQKRVKDLEADNERLKEQVAGQWLRCLMLQPHLVFNASATHPQNVITDQAGIGMCSTSSHTFGLQTTHKHIK